MLSDFALKFNLFIEQVNEQLRKEGKAQEILFIVDGLEKALSAETRRKVIIDEANRIRLIRVNTIFTLPIELMGEEQKIKHFAEVVLFPCVKLLERNNTPTIAARNKFKEFIDKRIDRNLFENEAVLDEIITFSGGSPRQLLRILEKTNWVLDEETDEKIQVHHVKKAIEQLGNEYSRSLTPEDFAMMRILENNLKANKSTAFYPVLHTLIQKEIVFEYNDGTYKRVNPIVAASRTYKENITV